MAVDSEPGTRVSLAESRPRGLLEGVLRWLPGPLVFAVVAWVTHRYGVSWTVMARFVAYVGLAISLPGTLIWRALSGRPRYLAEDVAAGTMVGYAVEVLSYIPARAVGQPRLVLTIPVLALLAFALVPRLRRFWRGDRGVRVPLWWAWAVAVVVGAVVVLSALLSFRLYKPDGRAPYIDLTYHLALAGELKHHMPPTVPYVLGEPLRYHWFFYSDLAATNWVTGISLQTLLFRLALLPVLAAFAVLAAVAGRRFTGRWWAGIAVVLLTFGAVAPSPYGWTTSPVPDTSLLTQPISYLSPTQTFGAALFIVVALVLRDLLSGERSSGRWALLVLVLAAVMGAKATYLPMLAAGLVLLVVVRSLVERRMYWAGVPALAITGVVLLFAQYGLYGGASQGLRLEPFATMKASSVIELTHLVEPLTTTPLGPCLAAAAIFLACYALMWPGLLVLPGRWTTLTDPVMLVLLGIGAAGIGAVFVFGHPGLSQVYFLSSARPYLAIASVWAVSGLATWNRKLIPWVMASAVLGALATLTVRHWGPDTAPHTVSGLLLPLATLLTVLALGTAVLWLIARVTGLECGMVLTVTAASAAALVMLPGSVHDGLTTAKGAVWVAEGAPTAGRWLRAHSNPSDVVATNVHCAAATVVCDTRSFWVSAYSERRVLVEGWDYTARINAEARRFDPARQHWRLPFWNQELLATNDALFKQPSVQAAATLYDRYRVRWLFVDTHMNRPPPQLENFAQLVFQSKWCQVYRLPAPRA